MNAADKEKRDQDTHDLVRDIKAVLLGVNGDGGLVEDVKELSQSHYNLKRNFLLLVGILIGSGVLVGGVQLFLELA